MKLLPCVPFYYNCLNHYDFVAAVCWSRCSWSTYSSQSSSHQELSSSLDKSLIAINFKYMELNKNKLKVKNTRILFVKRLYESVQNWAYTSIK